MKVRIEDKEALSALSWQALKTYLDAAAWQQVDDVTGKAAAYQHTDRTGRLWEILVPLRRDLGDYASRMGDAVSRLARVEGRSELDVYDDLKRLSANGAQSALANADASREVHQKIRRWLSEENWQVSDVDDPQSIFNVMVTLQDGAAINLYQYFEHKDRITLNEHVVYNEQSRLALSGLSPDIRRETEWSVYRDVSLLGVECDEINLLQGELRYTSRIYFDGLTKDALVQRIRLVLRAVDLSTRAFRRSLEQASQSPEDAPKLLYIVPSAA